MSEADTHRIRNTPSEKRNATNRQHHPHLCLPASGRACGLTPRVSCRLALIGLFRLCLRETRGSPQSSPESRSTSDWPRDGCPHGPGNGVSGREARGVVCRPMRLGGPRGCQVWGAGAAGGRVFDSDWRQGRWIRGNDVTVGCRRVKRDSGGGRH